jgi:hypothetical protein
MGRAARPEAVGAGQKVLLVNGFQQHHDGALRHLVLEGWNAERPEFILSARFRDVDPTDRRGVVAAGFDAAEKINQVGLQVRLVFGRRHPVDAGGAILAGQPVGFPHPVQIDDMMQRMQRRSRLQPRQFGYPLPFRGQFHRAPCPFLFPVNGSQCVAPPFPRSGPGEPGSPISSVR